MIRLKTLMLNRKARKSILGSVKYYSEIRKMRTDIFYFTSKVLPYLIFGSEKMKIKIPKPWLLEILDDKANEYIKGVTYISFIIDELSSVEPPLSHPMCLRPKH